jgi:hypothetical protein
MEFNGKPLLTLKELYELRYYNPISRQKIVRRKKDIYHTNILSICDNMTIHQNVIQKIVNEYVDDDKIDKQIRKSVSLRVVKLLRRIYCFPEYECYIHLSYKDIDNIRVKILERLYDILIIR